MTQEDAKSMQNAINETKLYTVKEVAGILKTNIDYVHKLRKAGHLRFIKLGQFKVRKQTLEEFLTKFDGYDLTNPTSVNLIN